MQNVKLIGGAAVLAIVVGVGAYFYGSTSATPEIVTVSSLGCGVTVGGGTFGIPLEVVSAAAPAMAVSYAMFELPGIERSLRLNFDPNLDGTGNELHLVGETLNLPTTFGRNQTKPTRIRINCRDGQITGVRYERDRTNTTFAVLQQDIAEAAGDEPAATMPEEGADTSDS